MMTDAQAETVRELRAVWFDGENGIPFLPEEAFPNRDNLDSAHRRNVARLQKVGLLGCGDLPGQVAITQTTLDAYEEWYRKRGWKRD